MLNLEGQPVVVEGKHYPYLHPYTENPINNSYFMGLVLDFERSPTLQTVYTNMRNVVYTGMSERDVLGAVSDFTQEALPIGDYYAVGSLGARRQRERRAMGEQLTLEDFLVEGKGYCVQHTAVSALMIERLIGEGVLPGSVNIGRCQIDLGESQPGHVWTEYQNPNLTYVIDSAYKFVGTRDEYKPVLDRVLLQLAMTD